MQEKKRVAVLGSTGSIGRNALSAISLNQDRFIISALCGHENTELLAQQARQYRPPFVAVTGKSAIAGLPEGTEVAYGPDAAIQACEGADIVLLAIVGIAGLPAFVYCLERGIPVALATKEAMVCGGRTARELMDRTKTPILPVDSELSAIFQCLAGGKKAEVKRILLTASGGPFRTATAAQIQRATKAQALNHPNWAMGQKISIDSATMVNKGLEIMETRWLFDIPPEKITVVVHPESIVHSMVEFADNAILAQMGDKDMRLPILHALSYPDRLPSGTEPIDLFAIGSLHFARPDLDKFPCLALAYEAVKEDGALQLVFNSANEFAVHLFLRDSIPFGGIHCIIAEAMEQFACVKVTSFADIYELDRQVRAFCAARFHKISG